MGIPDYLTCLLRNLYAGQEAIVRTRHGTTDWFIIGKGYIKAIYCHPAYLTSMQSTSCEMPGWMEHKLKLRLPGEPHEQYAKAKRYDAGRQAPQVRKCFLFSFSFSEC